MAAHAKFSCKYHYMSYLSLHELTFAIETNSTHQWNVEFVHTGETHVIMLTWDFCVSSLFGELARRSNHHTSHHHPTNVYTTVKSIICGGAVDQSFSFPIFVRRLETEWPSERSRFHDFFSLYFRFRLFFLVRQITTLCMSSHTGDSSLQIFICDKQFQSIVFFSLALAPNS